MPKILISVGFISMFLAATVIMAPSQSNAERRKPSGTTTTQDRCTANYTACTGDCYLTLGHAGRANKAMHGKL